MSCNPVAFGQLTLHKETRQKVSVGAVPPINIAHLRYSLPLLDERSVSRHIGGADAYKETVFFYVKMTVQN